MPDEDVAFDDLIRGRIEFKAGSVPDYVIVRPNGDPLYTLTNPVDDAMMNINVVLRGEDLLSSTPRQIVLYRYLIELGVAKEMPLFGHMPYVMGQGNKKLSSVTRNQSVPASRQRFHSRRPAELPGAAGLVHRRRPRRVLHGRNDRKVRRA